MHDVKVAEKFRTTLYLDEDMWTEFRKLALDERTPATILVEQAMREYLERRRKKHSS